MQTILFHLIVTLIQTLYLNFICIMIYTFWCNFSFICLQCSLWCRYCKCQKINIWIPVNFSEILKLCSLNIFNALLQKSLIEIFGILKYIKCLSFGTSLVQMQRVWQWVMGQRIQIIWWEKSWLSVCSLFWVICLCMKNVGAVNTYYGIFNKNIYC